MSLLEREDLLTQLRGQFEEARSGSGRLVFLGGEAGVGKTSVARALVSTLPGPARVRWGACDPLSTPRPLGPFHDMEPLEPLVRRRLGRYELMNEILSELTLAGVMVIEDVHWADGATLDVLRFVGRRVGRTRSLVLATFRDDELDPRHPLQTLLGDLATAPECSRMAVTRLSPDAVAVLAADHALDADRLYRVTGGNPFYVTEVLAAPAWTVPATVADAVLARVARLSAGARELLDVVALEPGGLSVELAEELVPRVAGALDECTERGVLVLDGDVARFRHELARLAVAEAVPGGSRRRIHVRLLDALEARSSADPARLAHHADAAGDGERVLRHAPEAAAEASLRGAHREAAQQLGRAVPYADRLRPSELAELLSRWADERAPFDDLDAIVELRRQAVELRRRAGDRVGEGRELRKLTRALASAGAYGEAEQTAAEAVDVLEHESDLGELAFAHAQRAYGAETAYRSEDALAWSATAIELARSSDATGALSLALSVKGEIDVMFRHDRGGVAELEESAALALAEGDDEGAGLARLNIGAALMVVREYDDASTALEDARSFCTERDIDHWHAGASAFLARICFEQGRWNEAERLLDDVPEPSPLFIHATVLTERGRLLARRGHGDALRTLEAADELARAARLVTLRCPAVIGLVEALWLEQRGDEIARLAPEAVELLARVRVPWVASELALVLWAAGVDAAAEVPLVEPIALRLQGDWRASAAAWARLGCPYEQADALADGDGRALEDALRIFMRLGARPAADRVRERMRRAGISATVTPRTATRSSPGALTRRQLEVLSCLESGLSNAEIARRLFISEKTAGHHVSTILRKLEVRSRSAAVAEARKMGIATTTG